MLCIALTPSVRTNSMQGARGTLSNNL